MITGYDSVFIARTPVGAAVRAMLDGLHDRWPDMLVALGQGESSEMGPFLPWLRTRDAVPSDAGELYVARDAVMEQQWDAVGYSLVDGAEGPFAVLYQPTPRSAIAIRVDDEPYERDGFRFEPYPATLITAGLTLITMVTPGEESLFSRDLLASLGQSLAEEGHR